LAAVLQIAVHFHHIVELEYAIDDRLENASPFWPYEPKFFNRINNLPYAIRGCGLFHLGIRNFA